MIKSLKKGLDILEFFSARPQQTVTVTELCSGMNMKKPTCIGILNTLVALDYIEKLDRGKGYVLGPMAYWITRNSTYRSDLVDAVRPVIDDLAEATGCTVLLQRFINRSCFALYMHRGERLDEDFTFGHRPVDREHAYWCSTDRVWLAFQESDDIENFINDMGLPDRDGWPGGGKKELIAALERIRKDGYHKNENRPLNAFGISFGLDDIHTRDIVISVIDDLDTLDSTKERLIAEKGREAMKEIRRILSPLYANALIV